MHNIYSIATIDVSVTEAWISRLQRVVYRRAVVRWMGIVVAAIVGTEHHLVVVMAMMVMVTLKELEGLKGQFT